MSLFWLILSCYAIINKLWILSPICYSHTWLPMDGWSPTACQELSHAIDHIYRFAEITGLSNLSLERFNEESRRLVQSIMNAIAQVQLYHHSFQDDELQRRHMHKKRSSFDISKNIESIANRRTLEKIPHDQLDIFQTLNRNLHRSGNNIWTWTNGM